MGHDPSECTVPQCLKCRQERTTISRSHDTDDDDDDRATVAGGRLVADPDPRKKDPADAEPLPSAGRLDDDAVAALDRAFERVAEDTGPDAERIAERRRELDRRRREGSKVDLTERDIEEARMSTQEHLLDAIEDLTDTADTGATLRKQEGDADADDGAHGLREQDLIGAVASFLDGVSEREVRDAFADLRDDDGPDRDELADAVADHLGIPRDDAAELLDELAARGDGDDDTGTDAGDDGDGDTARSKAKATVRKSVPAVTIGSDRDGNAAFIPADGNPVPLDALLGR